MKSYSKDEAIIRMNRLGRAKKPFVFLIDYKQQVSFVEEPDNINRSEWLYDLNGFTNVDLTVSIPLPEWVKWEPQPVSLEKYRCSFNYVKREIEKGNSYLANLTCETPVRTNLTLRSIFYLTNAKYKVWLKNRFVVFSPEIFIRIRDGFIYSYPMKGTIDAAFPNARSVILKDEKEAAEHATIVDLIRNDLSRFAFDVRVLSYRYTDVLQTNASPLLQVSSEIRGSLNNGFQSFLGDIVFGMLPAGSITGAPKCKTVDIIDKAEGYERGFYTGITGFFDGMNLDSAVLIRFLEERDGNFFFKSGGGITSKSNCVNEYNEMIQKVYVPIY